MAPLRLLSALLLLWGLAAAESHGQSTGGGAAVGDPPQLAAAELAVPPAKPLGFISSLGLKFHRLHLRCRQSPLGRLLRDAVKPLSHITGGVVPVPGSNPHGDAAKLHSHPKHGPPPAVGVAAKVEQEQKQAKVRVAAVKYLGTVQCHYYPEAEAALIASLRADRSECVRLAAAQALASGCCCTKATTKALLITVTGSEEDGNPAEISGRVRAAAYVALTQCLAGQTIHNSPSEPPGAGRPEYPGAEEVPPSQEPAGKLTTYYQTVGTEPQQQILGEAKRVVEQYQRVQVAGEQRQSGGSLAELWARSGDMESGQQPASIARRGGTPLPPASASEIRQPVFPLPSQGAVLQQRPAAAGTAYSSGASDPLPDQGFLFPLSGERDKRASMTSRLPDPGQYVR